MFLSLVRPDRISSPITSSAAVTSSWDALAVVMTTFVATEDRRSPTLPLWVMMHQVIRRQSGPRTCQEEGPMPAAPLRPIAYGAPRIVSEKAADGSLRLRS